MGLFNLFGKNKSDKEKIEDFANMKDTNNAEFITNSSVMGGVRMDAQIITLGEVITQPVITDDNRVMSVYNNAKPQFLNQLYKKVPLHGAIINNIVKELTKDYSFEYNKNVENDILFKKFINNTIKKDDFETFDDFLEDVMRDYLINGNIYIKEERKGGIAHSYSHLIGERVRITGDKNSLVRTGYAYNVDWIYSSKSYKMDKYNPNLSEGSQVLCFQNKKADYKFYGEPDYISAFDWLVLASNISDFYKQHIVNGVYPSVVMTFFEYPNNPEAMRKFQDMLASMGGKGSQGKILTLLGKNPDLAPKIDSLKANDMDDTFTNLQEDIGREICYAWGVDPQVMGMKTPGSLGSGNEIEYQTEKFEERLLDYKKVAVKLVQKMLDNADLTQIKFKYN
jgi:capsid portal protein